MVRAAVGDSVWGHGATTWAAALSDALGARGWTLATTERGTDGALVQLLRSLPAVVLAERRPADDDRDAARDLAEAERVRGESGADVGLAIRARPGGDDTIVHVAIATPDGTHAERRVAFLRGTQGADRAAIAGAAALLAALREG